MNLREIRILAGLTQKELAERSGVSQTMISAVERGEDQITLIKAKTLMRRLQRKTRRMFMPTAI